MHLRIIFVIASFGFSACHDARYITDFETRLRSGVRELFRSGKTTRDLQETIGNIGLDHFFDFNYQKYIDPQLICSGCEILVDGVINERKNGSSVERLDKLISDACINLGLYDEEVCRKAVHQNIVIVLYIIDNMQQPRPDRFCSIVFQEFFCEADEQVDWSIEIHNGVTRDKPQRSGITKKFLQVTDIHYDPLYVAGTRSNCGRPLCCQSDSGEVTDPKHVAGYWTDYNTCDLPLYTVVDTMKQIAERHGDEIDYVYFTGDIISHRVWSTSVENNTVDIKTILNVFADTFGDKPVFPILGNHEPHPLNVWVPIEKPTSMSSQWLFDLVSELWMRWLPETTKETIKKGGYYTLLVESGFRIIALNSNVGYSYNWWLMFDEVDPYGQLQWLENTLYEAEVNGEVVHILSHVPSGDTTSFIPWARQFRRILERYSNTITGIFNGHTHYVEHIVYHKTGEDVPINVAWNAGSLTPFTDNNPNYRVYTADTQSHEVLDFDEYIFNVTEANATPGKPPRWFKLYSFKEAFGLQSLDPDEISKLAYKMANEPNKESLKLFYWFKHTGGPLAEAECNDKCLQDTLCRLVTPVLNDDSECKKLLEQWT